MSGLTDAIAGEISEREQRKATLGEELVALDGQLAQLRTMAEQAQTLNGGGSSIVSPPPGETPDADAKTNGDQSSPGQKGGEAPDGRRPQSAGRRSGSAPSGSSRTGSATRGEGGGTKRAAVLAYVDAHGKVARAEVAAALGLDVDQTGYYLKALAASGQVQHEGSTRRRVYFTTSSGDQAAATNGRRLNITTQVRQAITNAIARAPGTLTETSLASTLSLDRELIADACGQLLEDDEIALAPDATYTISRGGGGGSVDLKDRIMSALQRCSSAWATSEVAYQAGKDGHGRPGESVTEAALTELEADGRVAGSTVMGGRAAWSVAE